MALLSVIFWDIRSTAIEWVAINEWKNTIKRNELRSNRARGEGSGRILISPHTQPKHLMCSWCFFLDMSEFSTECLYWKYHTIRFNPRQWRDKWHPFHTDIFAWTPHYFADDAETLRCLSWHHLGYFCTHDRLGAGRIRPPPHPALSRTNGRIEPREVALESSLRDLPKSYLRF